MTTYNGAEFLEKQLDSILSQSYQDFELIIVDDSSTDKTLFILHAYQKRFPKIQLYVNAQRLGFVKNFEKALSLSHGKYIALSDQDDIWNNDKLGILLKTMKSQEDLMTSSLPIMVHSDLCMMDEYDTVFHHSYFRFRGYQLEEKKDLGHILGPCGVLGNTVLINKILKEKILPFPEALAFHDYWIALICEIFGKRITLHRPLVHYRIHADNISNSCQNICRKKRGLSLCKSKLPYRDSNRNEVLNELCRRFDNIPSKDITLIRHFIAYLEFKTGRLYTFYILVIGNLVKKSWRYRLLLFIKILCQNSKKEV